MLRLHRYNEPKNEKRKLNFDDHPKNEKAKSSMGCKMKTEI